MAHTVPDAAAFKLRHPSFASVADVTVTAMLAEASRSVSTQWSEADYADAIMYLAAHLIAEENSAGGISAASKAGPIERVKADSVEIQYAAGAKNDGVFDTTVYGRRFKELRKRNAPRAIVV